ncbi:MAG: metal ABC transporter substrate-binding protein [Akkermansiaceae bacterium]|nr:metal ABC transporter substrate-binding protein [Akkermansiaceae bacterium]
MKITESNPVTFHFRKNQSWIRRSGLLLAASLCAWLAIGCSDQEKSSTSGKKRVVTSFTIIADMAREVAGDLVEVDSITKPGSEIHGYEPTPKDIVKAQTADLVLWNGMNLELWFEKFFTNVKNVQSAILTEGITPISIGEGPYSGKPNPHAWMSPANGAIYVENIRKALVKMDPANEAAYNANAAAYTAKINAVDEPVRQKLATIPVEQRWLVSSEGAFSYLCANYDLKQLYLWPINADAQGTPQQIRSLIDNVRANKIAVIFSESTVSDKPARQVAAETGARYGGVLYVDSLTDASGPAPTYLKLLEVNANTIMKGFSLSQ